MPIIISSRSDHRLKAAQGDRGVNSNNAICSSWGFQSLHHQINSGFSIFTASNCPHQAVITAVSFIWKPVKAVVVPCSPLVACQFLAATSSSLSLSDSKHFENLDADLKAALKHTHIVLIFWQCQNMLYHLEIFSQAGVEFTDSEREHNIFRCMFVFSPRMGCSAEWHPGCFQARMLCWSIF